MRSSYRRLVLLGLWALVGRAFFGCGEADRGEVTGPRLLDRLCETPGPGCILEGSARLTTGPTEDSVAVRIGPAPGALRVRWPRFDRSLRDSTTRLALVRGKGTLSSSNPCSLRDEVDWCELSSTRDSGTGGSGGDAQADLTLVAESRGGEEIDVVDLRETATLSGCSVASVGRR